MEKAKLVRLPAQLWHYNLCSATVMIGRFPAIYQKRSETSMERSIEWRRVPFDTSSIGLCSRHQNSRWWHSYIWLFLVKTRKWNMFFHREIFNGKTGLPFQNSTYSRELSRGTSENVCPINIPTEFPEFLSKWKVPIASHAGVLLVRHAILLGNAWRTPKKRVRGRLLEKNLLRPSCWRIY